MRKPKKDQTTLEPVKPQPREDHESSLTPDDELYLSRVSYFLKAAVNLLHASDEKLDGMTVASLLEPVVEDFHRFVHDDLGNRDSWSQQDREEGLGLVFQKREGAA